MTTSGLLPALKTKLKRPGLLGLAGQKIERELRTHLESYFRTLGRRIAALGLPQLVETHSKDIVRHTVEMRVRSVLRALQPLLKATLQTAIHDAMMASDKIHHFAEAEGDPIPNDPGLTAEIAAQYASDHAGEQVGGIDDTSLQIIQDVIETGIEDQLGVDGTAQLLQQELEDMTFRRAEMIAITEMNDAMSEAMLQKLDRIGIRYKQWISATQCCDICGENDDASPIPIDEDFPSGDMRPPAHPNCRCAVAGAKAPE